MKTIILSEQFSKDSGQYARNHIKNNFNLLFLDFDFCDNGQIKLFIPDGIYQNVISNLNFRGIITENENNYLFY